MPYRNLEGSGGGTGGLGGGECLTETWKAAAEVWAGLEDALPKFGRQRWRNWRVRRRRRPYRNLEGSGGGTGGFGGCFTEIWKAVAGLAEENAVPKFGRQRMRSWRMSVAEKWRVYVYQLCFCIGVVLTPSMEVLGMFGDDKARGAVIIKVY
jgi:hypothetical protein